MNLTCNHKACANDDHEPTNKQDYAVAMCTQPHATLREFQVQILALNSSPKSVPNQPTQIQFMHSNMFSLL